MANFTMTYYDPHFPLLYLRQIFFMSQGAEPILDDVYGAFLFLISLTGIVTNGLNIRAFLLQSAKGGDGVTVSLLSLSLSDFFFCVFSFVGVSATLCVRVETVYEFRYYVDPWVVSIFAVSVGYCVYGMTSLSTTFLAVARCMCVARPLQFNNTFTRSRSIAIHVCFAIVCLSGYIPVFSLMDARQAFNIKTNQTHITLWFSEHKEKVKDVVFLIFDTFMTFASQFVLVVCVLIMRHCLRQAGKFRHSTKAANLSTSAADTQGKDEDTVGGRYKLSGKELQVIQQVVLISAIYLICALPKVLISFYGLVEPEFDSGKKLYVIGVYVRRFFELVNSSSTFYIYCKYNSRFKDLYFRKNSKSPQ